MIIESVIKGRKVDEPTPPDFPKMAGVVCVVYAAAVYRLPGFSRSFISARHYYAADD